MSTSFSPLTLALNEIRQKINAHLKEAYSTGNSLIFKLFNFPSSLRAWRFYRRMLPSLNRHILCHRKLLAKNSELFLANGDARALPCHDIVDIIYVEDFTTKYIFVTDESLKQTTCEGYFAGRTYMRSCKQGQFSILAKYLCLSEPYQPFVIETVPISQIESQMTTYKKQRRILCRSLKNDVIGNVYFKGWSYRPLFDGAKMKSAKRFRRPPYLIDCVSSKQGRKSSCTNFYYQGKKHYCVTITAR